MADAGAIRRQNTWQHSGGPLVALVPHSRLRLVHSAHGNVSGQGNQTKNPSSSASIGPAPPEPPAAPLDPGMGMLRDAAHTGQILMRTGSSAHVQTKSEQRRRGEEGDRTTLMRERAALSAGSGTVRQWDGNSPKPFDRANVPRDRYAALAGSGWPTFIPYVRRYARTCLAHTDVLHAENP